MKRTIAALTLYTVIVGCLNMAAQAAEKTVLNVWHSETDPNTIAVIERVATRFEKTNPEVDVQVSAIGWVDLQQRIVTAIEGGVPPDLMQIEPHHAAYLVSRNLLQPLDDVIARIGADRIYPAVLDLQLYNGHRYGIAHGLGISYVSIRKDLLPPEEVFEVDTWDDLERLYQAAQHTNPGLAPLLLPANDLHMMILFSELLASNGGSIFTEDGRVDFNTPQIRETLEFLRRLYNLVPVQLRSAEYVENFTHYAQGKTFSLPGFFGRGTVSIELQSAEALRSPEHFSFVPRPRGPSAVASGLPGFATIDAEPWVIPALAKEPELAKRFLEFFYETDNYLEYATSVPIHLTPILRDLAESAEYMSHPHVAKWLPYHQELMQLLEAGTVRPIFMSAANDRLRPALYRLEGIRVVPEMIRAVYEGTSVEEAVTRANKVASRLTEGLPPSVEPGQPTFSDSTITGKTEGATDAGFPFLVLALLLGVIAMAVAAIRRKQ